MDKANQYKKLIRFLTGVLIIAIHGYLFAYIWYDYYIKHIRIQFWRRGNWAVIGVYVLVIYLFTKIYGGFKIGYARVMDLLYSHMISLLCANVFLYVELCIIGRDYMNPIPLIEMTFVQVAVILIWMFFSKLLYDKIYPPRQMLLIYGEELPTDFINKINARKDRYKICDRVHISEGTDKILQMIDNYEAVIICECTSSMRNVIMKYCFNKSIRTYMVPKVSDILIMGAEDMHIFDTPLLLARNQGFSGEEVLFKRIIDIIISLVGIILSSPIMVICGICVKLYDRGPVFYKQVRLTVNNKQFEILKFRSMVVNSEKDGARLAKKKDDRITPVGKVLRNLHFDELPQLFNILKGDMSVVGPRPERPEIFDKYVEEMPEFQYRLKVKAGLTGFAQVYGKYNTTPRDKLKLDLKYIEQYSFWLDIKLMLLTIKIMFQKETSEGVSENQITASKEAQAIDLEERNDK